MVKRGLEHMCETDQIFEAEGARPALNRMDGAEDGVDRLRIMVATFHGEQARLQFSELFFAFLKERLFNGRHSVHGSPPLNQAATRRTAATSFIGSKGLTIQPVGPGAAGAIFFLRIAFRCQNEDRQGAVFGVVANFLDKAEAIETRHVDVG